MVTILDYPEDAVEAAHAILLEVLTALGEYRDALVVVGGWVPPLTFPDAGHVGSLDIDLALNEQLITDTEYDTILEYLRNAGYRTCSRPNQFERDVVVGENHTVTVRLDLLSAEYGGTGRTNRHQRIQDIQVRKARGTDLAFQYFKKLSLTGKLPEGGINSLNIRIAEIVPFIIMKGMAIYDRIKQKDSYDIHFCLQHYPGGIPGLVQEFQPWISHNLVIEGLRKIRSKFSSVEDVGPVWSAQFVGATGEEFEIVRRDAFERVTALLDELRIVPWDVSLSDS